MLKDAGMNLERRDTGMTCFGGEFTLGIRYVLQPTTAFIWSSNGSLPSQPCPDTQNLER